MPTIPYSIKNALEAPYQLSHEQIAYYQQYRFIKLKGVFNKEVIDYFSPAISKLVTAMSSVTTAVDERDTYGKAFLQIFNLWTEDELVKEFIFSKRMAKIAAELL